MEARKIDVAKKEAEPPKFAEYKSDPVEKESIYKVKSNDFAVNHRAEDFNNKTARSIRKADNVDFGNENGFNKEDWRDMVQPES